MMPIDFSAFFSFLKKRLRKSKDRTGKLIGAIVLLILLIGAGIYVNAPPGNFPSGTVFSVPSGSSISSISENLKAKGYISSSLAFRTLARIFGKKGIIAGDYYFPAKSSIVETVQRITRGVSGMMPAKVTIPEGYTVRDIAGLFQDGKFFKFDRMEFIALAKSREGYLFPDTYFFMPTVTAADVVERLSDNFDTKVGQYTAEIASSTHSGADIIKVASIVEKEAATSTDREIIAGIIWNRLKKGMTLQIDATLGYVLDKGTFQLTSDDLALDNPYNTYVYKGLPPTPISNPGLDSIDAALHPTTTPYLYYLSDKNGVLHYAKTFEEHKHNRELFLGK